MRDVRSTGQEAPKASPTEMAATVDPAPGQVVARHADVLLGLGRFQEAADLARAWLRGAPHDHDVRVILGHALRETGEASAAVHEFRTVLAADPDHLAAGAGLAISLFHAREWQAAFEAYEVRFRLMETPPEVTKRGRDGKPATLPRWLGTTPVPKSLLVMCEQGLGDTIQFARYLPRLAAICPRVVAVVQPRLITLLKPLAPSVEWRSADEKGSVAACAGWLSMLDLPRALGLAEAEFASAASPIVADPALRPAIASRLTGDGFRVGLVWQGNPDRRIDQGRSLAVADLAPLTGLDGVTLVSLQHGAAAGDLKREPGIQNLGASLDTGPDGFVETAAAIAELDLVISVDTATAHLAAAMGKPVWLLLKTPGADWRWLHGSEHSVWYETLRIFRQKRPGDWAGVMTEVAEALRICVSGTARAPQSETVAGPRLIPSVLSVGAFFDRLAEVTARLARETDARRKSALLVEQRGLQGGWHRLGLDAEPLKPLVNALSDLANRRLKARDRLAELEAAGNHGPAFIEAARAVILLDREQERLIAALDAEGTRRVLPFAATEEAA